jgi:hypothetical protein
MKLRLTDPLVDDARGFHFKPCQRLGRKLDSNPQPKPVGGLTFDGLHDMLGVVAGYLDNDRELIHGADVIDDHSKFLNAREGANYGFQRTGKYIHTSHDQHLINPADDSSVHAYKSAAAFTDIPVDPYVIPCAVSQDRRSDPVQIRNDEFTFIGRFQSQRVYHLDQELTLIQMDTALSQAGHSMCADFGCTRMVKDPGAPCFLNPCFRSGKAPAGLAGDNHFSDGRPL